MWPKVQKLLDKRGWREALPRLHEAEIFDHGDEGFDVFFTIDDEERLKTRWRYDASGWRISRFMFSKL